MALPTVTGEFRVVEDPELRFSPNGVAVGTVRLVASSRKKNEQTDEWEDDKILWVTGTAFKQFAEKTKTGCPVLSKQKLKTCSAE